MNQVNIAKEAIDVDAIAGQSFHRRRNVFTVFNRGIAEAPQDFNQLLKHLIETQIFQIDNFDNMWKKSEEDPTILKHSLTELTIRFRNREDFNVGNFIREWFHEQGKTGIDLLLIEPNVTHTKAYDAWLLSNVLVEEIETNSVGRDLSAVTSDYDWDVVRVLLKIGAVNAYPEILELADEYIASISKGLTSV